MKTGTLVPLIILAFITNSILFACQEKTGVCTACCGSNAKTYCYDNWTEAECKEWNDKQVNGLPWHWHEGQTCAGR